MGDCFNYRLQTSIWITGRWFFNCKKEKWHPFGWKLWPLLSEVLDRQDISCIFKLININSQGNWYAHCLCYMQAKIEWSQLCYFLLFFRGLPIQLCYFISTTECNLGSVWPHWCTICSINKVCSYIRKCSFFKKLKSLLYASFAGQGRQRPN